MDAADTWNAHVSHACKAGAGHTCMYSGSCLKASSGAILAFRRTGAIRTCDYLQIEHARPPTAYPVHFRTMEYSRVRI